MGSLTTQTLEEIREKAKYRARKYRKKHSKKIWYRKRKVTYDRDYHMKHRKEINERRTRNYHKNPKRHYKQAIKFREKCLNSWLEIIPRRTKCQICGSTIFYRFGKTKHAIRFDHRNGGKEKIKTSPMTWLRSRQITTKRKKDWESCNFGMLCNHCNVLLPTKKRKQWLAKVTKYINMEV